MGSARLTYLLALLLMQWTSHAQWRGPKLTRLGPADGLPTSVFDMTQDSTGYLYLAGNAGMYRYDGNQFEFFGHDPLNEKSIGPGDVYSIYAASDGLIWLTLRFGGLNSYDPMTRDFARHPLPEHPDRNDPGANAIYEDEEGTLWIGGSLFRLMTFDRKKKTFTSYTPDWIDLAKNAGRLTILSIIPDNNDPQLLWLSVLDYRSRGSVFDSYGLVSFDTRTKYFQDYPCGGYTQLIDQDGILWGTYWGNWICMYNPASQECDSVSYTFSYDDKIVDPLAQDIQVYQEQFLVSTSLGILKYHHDEHFEVIAQPNTSSEFQSMFTDRNNNLWIGARQGAYVLNPDDQHIRFFSLSQFGVDVRAYPAKLAYHAQEDVIYFIQPGTPQISHFYQIPLAETHKENAITISTDFFVQAIACDYRQRIWASGNGALYLFDPETKSMTRSNLTSPGNRPLPGLIKMSSHPDGWVAGYNSNEFIWFHADSQTVHRLNQKQLIEGSGIVRNGFEGFTFAKNNKAFLYSDDIYKIDLQSGKAQQLKYDSYFNPNQQDIQYVGEDAAGNIWMSSFTLVGKYRLEGDSLAMLDAFTIEDGMISPTSIELHIDDQGRIWAFTISGMNCIDPVTREVRFFGINEGLPDSWVDPVQVITVSDGRIATHCANGMIVFDPVALWNSVTPSSEKVVINQIRIGGDALATKKSINSLGSLELMPGHGAVDIEFQGLAFPTDVRMEYSYRLKGLQDDWLSLGKNKLVTLPSLSPGTYTLEVKTGKPHSNAPIKSLAIVVGKPFFLRWWFITLVVLILISAIIAIMQWRIRLIRKQEEARVEVSKKIAELELKALRSQMNPHFMFNSLNSIKNYILHAEPKLAAEYLSNFAHLIRMILQNSREKSISLKDELETLILYVDLEKLRFDDEFDFIYLVDDAIHLEDIKIPPMLLQPYVENAIWHGLMHKKVRGHLLLQFVKQDNMIACIIDDDGVGRENALKMKSLSATRYKSMGMGITQDRIEIMNKMDALGITSEIKDKHDASGKPAGTRVIVRIPASNDLYS